MSRLHVAMVAVLAAVYCLCAALLWPYTMDDAYISLRYASHLAEGKGLVWNPGGAPVEGFSNVLWVLWMAVACLLSADPMLLSKLLGALLGLATVLLLVREGREVVGRGAPGLLPAAMLACSPMFAFWSVSGIEMPAFAFCLLAGYRGLRISNGTLAAPALAAATLLRPEGIVLACAAGGAFLLSGAARGDRRASRAAAGAIGLALAAFAGLIGWRLARYGGLMPNTVHAKWAPLGGVRYFLGEAVWYLGVPLLLGVWGAVAPRTGVGGRRSGRRAPPRPRPEGIAPARSAALAAWAVILCQASVLANTRPAMGFYLRLVWPVAPLLFLPAGLAIASMLGDGAFRRLVASATGLLVAFPLVRDMAPVRLPGAGASAPVARTAWAVREILDTVHAPLAAWVAVEHPGALVAVTDCGLLPYASGARIIDLWGLNDPVIARQGFDAGEVLSRRPDLLVLASRSGERFEGRFGMDRALQAHPVVAERYRLVRKYTWRNDLDRSGDYSLWVYGSISAGGGAGGAR